MVYCGTFLISPKSDQTTIKKSICIKVGPWHSTDSSPAQNYNRMQGRLGKHQLENGSKPSFCCVVLYMIRKRQLSPLAVSGGCLLRILALYLHWDSHKSHITPCSFHVKISPVSCTAAIKHEMRFPSTLLAGSNGVFPKADS